MPIPKLRYSLATVLIALTFMLILLLGLQGNAQANTSTQPTDVIPLPDGCIRGTPPGQDAPVCCISGLVIIDGQPISGAVVSIADAQGVLITTTTQVYEGLDSRPQYVIDLSRLIRPVKPTDVITLVARYSGISSPAIQYVVQPGGQNYNLIIYEPNALAVAGQMPGQADFGKFDRVQRATTDSQGNVYVVDWLNTRVQVFRPDGTFLRAWGETGTAQHQFSPRGMSGIAIDKRTDTVYVGNSSQNEIKKFTTDGDYRGRWQHWTLSLIADLQVDAAGDVYVLAYRGGLFKFAPDGQWLRWPEWPNAYSYIWSNQVRLAITPDGNTYSHKGNTLYRFDAGVPVTLTTILTDGTPLSTTYSIAADADGFLYVAERPSGTRVIKLAVRPNNVLEQVPWPWHPSPTDRPVYFNSMAIDGDNLYITGDFANRIWQFGLDGSYRSGWGGPANNPEQIGDPRGLAIAPGNEALYLTDCATGRISKIISDTIVKSWGAQELSIPATNNNLCAVGLAFDATGQSLFAVGPHRLDRYTVNGDQIRFDKTWGTNGPGIDQFVQPNALAVDRNGTLYIADTGNHRVKIVNLVADTPQTVAVLTEIAPGNPITRPYGIAVDDTDPTAVTVYVAEYGECITHPGRLLRFTFTQGQIQDMRTWSPGGWDNGSAPFICPTAVYVRNGNLYATINYQTSNNYYVYKLDKAGLLTATYGTVGPELGQFSFPVAVAVNNQGEMWVSDSNNSRLQRFKPMATSGPVATIVHLSASSLVPGEQLTAIGAGQDGDTSNEIIEYIWTSDQGLILTRTQTTTLIATTDGPTRPDALGPGLHRLQLRVRDNERDLSAPATVLVFVAQRKPTPPLTPVPTPDVQLPPPTPPAVCLPGGLWTFLLYLDADYLDGGHLDRAYQNALTDLGSVNHACIQVAIQIDSPGMGDARRYYKRPGEKLQLSPTLTTTEIAMDDPQALSAFVAWGQKQLPADHYYLALANHGDGVRGTLWDHTSNPNGTAYLRVAALRSALEDARILPIDILHLDSCSMALLEVAYQLREKVKYLIASQYLGWSFFAYGDYARYAGDYPEPATLAQQIVRRYAALAASRQLPATLSVLDLRRIEPVKNGLDDLAVLLKAWVGNDSQSRQRHQQLEAIRRQSQQFDSNLTYTNNELDVYVDLLDWLGQLRDANLNHELTAAAVQLLGEFTRTDKLILENKALNHLLPKYYADGQFVDLSHATGLSIYYPLEGQARVTSAMAANSAFPYTQLFADYLDHKLFDFTRVSHWDEFLRASFGTPPSDPTQLDLPLPPAAPLIPPQAVYLPVVMR